MLHRESLGAWLVNKVPGKDTGPSFTSHGSEKKVNNLRGKKSVASFGISQCAMLTFSFFLYKMR